MRESGKKSIHSWSEDARPREKMMKFGADSLSNSELLAILIGSGTQDEDAVSLMEHVMEDHHNNLDEFCRMSYEDLVQYKGIGPAKAITLLSAIQLSQRRAASRIDKRTKCDTPEKIYEILVEKMRDLTTEVCYVLALDQHLHYVADKQIALGGFTATIVDPRVVLRYILSKNAVAMVLAHNHPSGTLNPSKEDDNLTQRVKGACEAVGIRFVDHLIVTGNGYYSYSEHGVL